MTNLILGIIAFAGVVCAAWLSARENNRLKEQLDELQDENDRLHTAFDALDIYLPKIIHAGHRVAICEQLDDPKK